MKLFLEKIKIKEFLKTCNKNVSILIPHPESYEDYKKLNLGLLQAEVKQTRKLQYHKKFIAVLNSAIDNGVIERIVNKYQIKPAILESLYLEHKNDLSVLIYIMKWLFLPFDTITIPDGNRIKVVSSMSFDKLDQAEFSVFFDKCINELSEILGIESYILLSNS